MQVEKYKLNFKNNFIRELDKLIKRCKNLDFKKEINYILENKYTGYNVIHDIKNIIKNNEKFSIILKKTENILQNRNLKRITILIVICAVILTTNSIAYAVDKDVEAFIASEEFHSVQEFIRYIIVAIRSLVTAICGMIAANSGLKLVTEDNLDGAREAKKSFQKIIWALFLVFAGTALASLLAKKLLIGAIRV